ncbi:HDOD domain-containing protein [Aeromonas sp. MR19]|jgi:EAL and modified HD-GYP domain-containing signal transduction protein|uniref:HDOD domain-containing protein n=1 Tax=Aeromonas bestiarum TaxID=105751 RepID=A0AAW7IEN9_9GAMM|nr:MULTISPECIES: HDOD domain-containing protein [Aeromonas]EKP0278096.1 HDOD domain-containing protein [Aeromonas bestiarum]MCH7376340.1 HDOD domain-containing protein [Aeromonas sp. MR19]MDM5140914.1 HDOD domain-containing protein [Aeromonas bestiarum]
MLLRRYPIFNRRLALVAYGMDYQLADPAEWTLLATQCRLLAQGRQYLLPFSHEQLDEQRPLLFDQDTIPLVEASAERLPASFPVLAQWRDYRRRLAVHGAQREPRWFNASRLLVFWMGEEGISQPTEHKRMALDIETWGDFLPLKEAGVDFFAGGFLARPELVNQRAAQPDMKLVQEILQIICHEEFSFARVASLLEQDAWLPGQLMTYVNAPGFDHASPIVSVTRALSYLGEQEIRKFVLIYGLARVSQHMPEACTRMAIARGRFCELIAVTALGKAAASWAFLVGLVLDGSLLSEQLKAHLPKDVKRALESSEGPLFHLFQLVKTYEQGNWPLLAQLAPSYQLDPAKLTPIYFQAQMWGQAFLAT